MSREHFLAVTTSSCARATVGERVSKSNAWRVKRKVVVTCGMLGGQQRDSMLQGGRTHTHTNTQKRSEQPVTVAVEAFSTSLQAGLPWGCEKTHHAKRKKKKTHCSEEAAVLCGGWRAPHYPDLSIWSGHCVHAVLGLPPLNAWHIHFVLETRWRIISRQLPINCPSERSSVVWLIWPSVIRPSQNTLDVFFR